jgi:membrane protease YdiL (CAAX protease family)
LGGEPKVNSNVLAPLVGLVVALGGPLLLVSPASRVLGRPDSIVTKLLEQAVLWLFLAVILAVVLLWERQPLTSMWLQPFHWHSLAWGLLLAAAMIYLVFPFRVWLVRISGLPDFQAGLERVLSLPIWFRVLAVVTAGVVEETLFHGYAITRLGVFIGSYWLAAVFLVPAFAFVHLPFWGRGFVLSLLPAGALSAAFFIWKQDLCAMIVAHTVVDAMGLIFAPPASK